MPVRTARPLDAYGPALLAGRNPRAPAANGPSGAPGSTFRPHAIRIEQSTKGESEP